MQEFPTNGAPAELTLQNTLAVQAALNPSGSLHRSVGMCSNIGMYREQEPGQGDQERLETGFLSQMPAA